MVSKQKGMLVQASFQRAEPAGGLRAFVRRVTARIAGRVFGTVEGLFGVVSENGK